MQSWWRSSIWRGRRESETSSLNWEWKERWTWWSLWWRSCFLREGNRAVWGGSFEFLHSVRRCLGLHGRKVKGNGSSLG